MMKQARLEDDATLLPESNKELTPVPFTAEPKLPKSPTSKDLRMTTLKGKEKPSYTHEFKMNSPYREN